MYFYLLFWFFLNLCKISKFLAHYPLLSLSLIHTFSGNTDPIHFFFPFKYLIFNKFPGGSEVKVSACNAGDLGLIPESGRFPWRSKWQPTPVLLPGESHGWRNLMGDSPRGCKELDTTERLHFQFSKCS